MKYHYLRSLALVAALACAALATPWTAPIASAAVGECDLGPSYYTHETAAICTSKFAPDIASAKTRPANTVTYTIGTAWADATTGATYWTFTGFCRYNGASMQLTDVHVTDKANQTTKLTGTLYLFTVAPTPINDNTTFNIASTDWDNMVTSIAVAPTDVVNATAGAGGAVVQDQYGLTRTIKCAAGDSNLYGLFKVTNAYVPVTGEVLSIKLRGDART